MSPTVGVILTACMRSQDLLCEQIKAVKNQTVEPDRIVLWSNAHQFPQGEMGHGGDIECIDCSHNMGVWPRFSMVAEFDTDFICVFDDDTIPGPKWFENCIECFDNRQQGLYGAAGVTFGNGRRGDRTYHGWSNPAGGSTITQVDIVGHAWFFPTSWAGCLGMSPRRGTKRCGEDYYLSVSFQKHLKMDTYVPPHPEDKDYWGSTQGELGTDDVALYRQPGAEEEKQAAHDAYIEDGWRPMGYEEFSPMPSLRMNIPG